MNGNGMKVLWVMVISMFMSLGASAKLGGEEDSADSGEEQETKEECQAALNEPLFVKPTSVPDMAQIEKAAKIAKELCEDDTKALKTGSLKGEKLALKLMGYSGKTENAAVKFVLLRNAFRQFLMAGDIKNAQALFDRAFYRFGGRFAAEMANYSSSTLRKLANSPKLSKSVKPLLALVEESMASCKEIAEAEADLKKRSSDMQAKLKLALHAVKLQDWELALKTYAEIDGKRGDVCRWEIKDFGAAEKGFTCEQIGDFWWESVDGKDEQGLLFRSISCHAAYWYRKALAEEKMTELKSALVKKRLAKTERMGYDYCENKLDSEITAVTCEGAVESVDRGKEQCRDIVYELRFIDIVGDGAAEWNFTADKPEVDMDVFSSVGFRGKLSTCRTPLCKDSGWMAGKSDYWLRKEFNCKVDPKLLSDGYVLYKAEKAIEIWINGKEVTSSSDASCWHYHKAIVNPEMLSKGKNIIAVHVYVPNRSRYGYLDLGFYVNGSGLYGYARELTRNKAQFVFADSSSLKPESAMVKIGVHGGADWRYTEIKPREKWEGLRFDDSKWKEGVGGIGGGTGMGLRGLESVKATVRTEWSGDDLWMRAHFKCACDADKVRSALLCCRTMGGAARVYVNGKELHIHSEFQCVASYQECDFWQVADVTDSIRKLLVKGDNVLAVEVHCDGNDKRRLSYWLRLADAGLYIQ